MPFSLRTIYGEAPKPLKHDCNAKACNNEQDAIENILIQTALSIDYPVQFFSTTEYIDTSRIVSLIKMNKTSNIKIKEYQKYLIKYLETLMENRHKQFYIQDFVK